MTAPTFPHRPRRAETAAAPPSHARVAAPRDSLWVRMVERWRAAPETQDDYDARQW